MIISSDDHQALSGEVTSQASWSLWIATGLSRPERGDDEATVERSIAMGGQMLVMCDE